MRLGHLCPRTQSEAPGPNAPLKLVKHSRNPAPAFTHYSVNGRNEFLDWKSKAETRKEESKTKLMGPTELSLCRSRSTVISNIREIRLIAVEPRSLTDRSEAYANPYLTCSTPLYLVEASS